MQNGDILVLAYLGCPGKRHNDSVVVVVTILLIYHTPCPHCQPKMNHAIMLWVACFFLIQFRYLSPYQYQ